MHENDLELQRERQKFEEFRRDIETQSLDKQSHILEDTQKQKSALIDDYEQRMLAQEKELRFELNMEYEKRGKEREDELRKDFEEFMRTKLESVKKKHEAELRNVEKNLTL